jgi:ATP-binding cassette subfamily B protein
MTRRRYFAPEVIQTSAMDCGPASLKCLLEGFGVQVSYGRLREACQTDVDGTSIDVMEEVAKQLGLDAEQTMIPLDHLLLAEADAFPGILVVKNPDGNVHFVVAWRRLGNLVQVMDPASGRRWIAARDLLAKTFVHALPVPAEAWREWAGTPAFLDALRVRMRKVGALAKSNALLDAAARDPSWRSLAALDAATRLTEALAQSDAVDRGSEGARVLASLFEEALREIGEGTLETCIPKMFWSAGPVKPDDEGNERVLLRGAVLVRARGVATQVEEGEAEKPPLSPELAAALHERPTGVLGEVVRHLRRDGLLTPSLVAGATIAAGCAAALEALVLRGLFGVSIHLGRWEHRLAALVALAAFFALSLGVELPIASQTLRIGRRLELRLRAAFLAKLPRLNDRYFSSRPASDMAHRAHMIQSLRVLPQLGARILRASADLVIASIGLVWIDPRSWPYVLVAAATCFALPLASMRAQRERDARVRAFEGSLMRFYLDALLGLVPLRTHGAARSIRREHESMLGELRRAFLGLHSLATGTDALNALVSAAMAVGLLVQYLARGGEPAGALLLVYWALSLPTTGADLAAALRQYPQLRNTTERLLEPLGALEDTAGEAEGERAASAGGDAAEIQFVDVAVRAAGKTILEGVNLTIDAGSHVAIVGSSGAGKSSLCGLLLGWHRAASGEVKVDGAPLRGERIERLREKTAWVDPAIQLWNRSLLENIEYGNSDPATRLAHVLDSADVVRLLERLPDGLQTRLGDGGALVSGGEGQRVRLARAMMRERSRLVVLDEPFRGLDREKRRELLARARRAWSKATLLCVTHDVGETLEFPRVLVIDEGRVVEDGDPRALAADASSRYRALLDSERVVRRDLWRGKPWRRLELRAGVLAETYDEGEK